MSAGLTTAIRIGDAAAAILHTARKLDKGGLGDEWDRDEHIGVQPMLLAFSMELALKAWYAFDYDRSEVVRSHDLSKLFTSLTAESQRKLETAFVASVAPHHPGFFSPPPRIEDVFCPHTNAFIDWRYLHEPKGNMAFDDSLFVDTLEMVIREFRKRCQIETVPSPLRPF